MVDFSNWSVLTADFLIILYLALGGVTLSAILHLANGKWRFQVRYLACSLAVLFPLAFILLLILLANGDTTFQWLAHAHEGGEHLNGWHNYTFLVLREVIGFAVIVILYGIFIKYQHLTDIDSSYPVQRRFRNLALLIPFAYVLYGSMVAWDFEMTMQPGWHSASYAFYFFQSNFHCFLAFFTIFLYGLHKAGNLSRPFEGYIFNYMAQFMLGMTILYTYLYFTQYLIMWYGRFPEEMGRYFNMMFQSYPELWWTFLALKFIIPFSTLAITPNRHNPTIIVMVAVSIVVGTWIERYTWIAGSVHNHAHIPMTSFFDLAVTAGVVIVAWLSVRWALVRYGLIEKTS